MSNVSFQPSDAFKPKEDPQQPAPTEQLFKTKVIFSRQQGSVALDKFSHLKITIQTSELFKPKPPPSSEANICKLPSSTTTTAADPPPQAPSSIFSAPAQKQEEEEEEAKSEAKEEAPKIPFAPPANPFAAVKKEIGANSPFGPPPASAVPSEDKSSRVSLVFSHRAAPGVTAVQVGTDTTNLNSVLSGSSEIHSEKGVKGLL